MSRRIAVLLTTFAMAAPSCSDGAASSTTGATSTSTTAADSTTTTMAGGIPVDPDLVPPGDPDLLAALVFFPGELPAPYDTLPLDPVESGYSPAGGSLANALDPADEADDIVRFGQVAEFGASYGDPNEVGVAFNAAQFATAAGAAAYLEDWIEDLRSASDQPSPDRFTLSGFRSESVEGLGDQALRVGFTANLALSDGTIIERPGGAVAVRRGRLVLWLWGNGPQSEQILDDLAEATADRVVGVADGDIPPRDHTLLGLTDPPTLALESFAFTYEYGIEAPEGGFLVSIEGLFQGPDRASCTTVTAIDGFEPVETYLVTAGTRVWLGDQTGYQEIQLRDPAALSALASCPGHPNHWELTRLHRLEITAGEEVTVSGIPALRSDLTADPAAMDAAGIIDEEMSEFTRYEVTVAAAGGWPIQLVVEREMTVEAALRLFGIPSDGIAVPSHPATTFERLLLTRIDDPDIVVDLPLPVG